MAAVASVLRRKYPHKKITDFVVYTDNDEGKLAIRRMLA
jgi:hypothetical protein